MNQQVRTGLIGTVLFLSLFWVQGTSWKAGKDLQQIHSMSIQDLGNRLVVIAPHPDDEVLAAGGLIQQAIRHHKEVLVLFMTSGDGFRKAAANQFGRNRPTSDDLQRLGVVRYGESLRSLATLGIDPAHVVTLGFPDGSLLKLWESIDGRRVLTNNGATFVPYTFAYEPCLPYTREALIQSLSDILVEQKPTDIISPSRMDTHVDHRTTNLFLTEALHRTGIRVATWKYVIHFPNYPKPWLTSLGMMSPPHPLTQDHTSAKWYWLQLDFPTTTTKFRALEKHHTQLSVMPSFLRSFIRKQEVFERD